MPKHKPENELVTAGTRPTPVRDLIARVESGGARKQLRSLYGDDDGLIADREAACLRVLTAFARRYGADRKAILVRSPARINLMGVHVEHRRGEVNYVTHRREILMVAEQRPDERIVMNNASRAFPERTFRISQEIKRGPRSDWQDYIDSPGVLRCLAANRGDWVNYVKSAVLRLQFRFPKKALRGMNLMVDGDIPQSAGLSSSSALVVSSALAMAHLNRLRISRGELIVLCGEGEWYVGTRGGAGDHAAMIVGRRGYISHLRFFPFEMLEYVPLPKTYRVVICNSLRRAKKSADELSAYNQTIAAYGTVLLLMKDILQTDFQFSPAWLERNVKHLGDFNLNKQRFPDTVLYEVLRRMPQRISREELLARLPAQTAALHKMFRTHNNPEDGYRARAVAMFGLSEIARGAACVKPLKRGDYRLFGKLMYISHDGDRIVRHVHGRKVAWDNDITQVTDAYLRRLIRDSASADERKRDSARLMMQPGGYRCSSECLDLLVDIAAGVKGVAGAGLTGAGFGGAVLVLVKNSSIDALLSAVRRRYYDARRLPFSAEVCTPVAGACVVEL